MTPRTLLACTAIGLLPTLAVAGPPSETWAIGVARIDITPTYPVRLGGFGFRRTESEGVTQRIGAKALALGGNDPAVLVTVDNVGVPASMVEELARRLAAEGVRRERLAVASSHTHTGPMLTGVCPTLFGMPIPKEHQEHIDRYTRELADKLEKVARAALADRKPARLAWGVGSVGFARNRRTPGAPVDHDLPVLVVRDLDGKLRAIWARYACHCVTLSNNKISGDWAGYAQQAIEDDNPGVVALISIGCAGDANPDSGVTGDKTEVAAQQGKQIASEVKRLLEGYLAPVTGPLVSDSRSLELPLAEPPDRKDWQERAKKGGAVGYHAQVQLARVERGEALKTMVPYRVQTWSFGDSLAMVFLPGEVVVDYSLRLKRELNGLRLWINAYTNDAPCYVPSERVLKEGGYEGGAAMIYYDLPGPFRPGLEDRIVGAVKDQLGKRFGPTFDTARTGGTLPLSPQQSRAAWKACRPYLAVDLVAAEPLISSPVAIDFGPDGKLWVAEMADYPMGTDGKFKPGGRVRLLEDTDSDGMYDKATIFLDNIPFPTGVTVWRKGVLVCAAPDILYAEDTDGDGKADVIKKLYSGFGTDNYQARVNSLSYGLDGWVYGSCGLFGGKITSHKTGKVLDLGDRDFRIKPDTGEIEPATGRTQQGRARDDWGNWFGCDNSDLCRHYVLDDHYLRRNPFAGAAQTAVHVPDRPDGNRLYPIRPLQLFKLSGPAGQVTAACGLGVYRDDVLPPTLRNDTFTCEPVNHVVHHEMIGPRGCTFIGRRAPEEQTSEFLASTDAWSRPVQVRTGPDGGLWVVDMYRHVIEHPRWVPPEDLAKLDVRAGHDLGRIYRVRMADQPLRKVPRLDKLDTADLVAALNTPNGTVRDLVGQMLVWRGDKSAVRALGKMALARVAPPDKEVRMQALCVLGNMGVLPPAAIVRALQDTSGAVQRQAVRLAEPSLRAHPELGAEIVRWAAANEDAQVRLQAAYSLRAWRDPGAGKALVSWVANHPDETHLIPAVLSSVRKDNLADFLGAALALPRPPEELVQGLIATAIGQDNREALNESLRGVLPRGEQSYVARHFLVLGTVLDRLVRLDRDPQKVLDEDVRKHVVRAREQARKWAANEMASEEVRLAAIGLIGLPPDDTEADALFLLDLVKPQSSANIQAAALFSAGRVNSRAVSRRLIEGWRSWTPAVRSQVLDLLLARDAWLRDLLTALEKKTIPPAQIDTIRRQRLLAHRDAAIRARAAKAFEVTNADRQKVLDEYAGVTALKSNAARGKAIFAKTCANCHRLDGVGHEVGPDLAASAGKTAAYFLQEVLDPNRNVDPRYQEYAATTKAGRIIAGLLAAETATSITLRSAEGKQETLLRSEIDELFATAKSLMPDGLEKDITKQDMADLIAYLSARPTPPKRFAGNEPAIVRPDKGVLWLRATNAAIFGNDICFEPQFNNIGCWHAESDHVVWTVETDREQTYNVYLDWACNDAVAGNAWSLEAGRKALRGRAAATGGWDKYKQAKVGTLTLPAGTHRLVFRPDGPVRGALLDLRGLQLVPEGQKPTFP